MSDESINLLKKEVAKKKRIASEWASQLHDLVEDQLPAGYADLPKIAQATYDACKDWAEAEKRYQDALAA
jgi:hypothetical protein